MVYNCRSEESPCIGMPCGPPPSPRAGAACAAPSGLRSSQPPLSRRCRLPVTSRPDAALGSESATRVRMGLAVVSPLGAARFGSPSHSFCSCFQLAAYLFYGSDGSQGKTACELLALLLFGLPLL